MIGINETWVVEFFRHDVKIKAAFLRYVSSFQNLFIFKFSTYSFAQNSRTHFLIFTFSKGQLISKANCQAVNSSKKRTNEFVFTIMQCVFVRFLEEIEDTKKAFRN